MESIEALREYAGRFDNSNDAWSGIARDLSYIAYAIEREVGEMQRALTIDAKPMTDENMAERGWVRLPLDANGDVLHIGELVDEKLPFGGYAAPAPIDTMELSLGASGYRWMVKLDAENGALISPKLLRHHAPTVEDVLREFVDALDIDRCEDFNATIAEFAKRLRLAGDE